MNLNLNIFTQKKQKQTLIGWDSRSATKMRLVNIVNFLVVPASQTHGDVVKGQVWLLFWASPAGFFFFFFKCIPRLRTSTIKRQHSWHSVSIWCRFIYAERRGVCRLSSPSAPPSTPSGMPDTMTEPVWALHIMWVIYNLRVKTPALNLHSLSLSLCLIYYYSHWGRRRKL